VNLEEQQTMKRGRVGVYQRYRRRLCLPFLTPAAVLYLTFFVYPGLRALYFSLFDWSGFTQDKKFIGLGNFRELLRDSLFWLTTERSVIVIFIGGALLFFFSFLFAMFISNGIKFGKTFKNIIFFPVVVPPVAITTLWGFIYNSNWGLLNSILKTIGLGFLARAWTDINHIFGSMLVMIVWANIGFYLVILLSAIRKIPSEYFEVAKVEGAGMWSTLTRVTIPMIWDVVAVAVVYWGIAGLKMFELIFSFTGFLPKQSIWTLPVYTYIIGFGKIDPVYRLGYSTALATLLFFFVMAFVLIGRKLMNRESVEY
jgi:ABC-type sugar transport system permease subunit